MGLRERKVRKMKIDDLTIGEAKQLVKMFGGFCGRDSSGSGSHSLEIGEVYLVQTVTNYYSGRLVAVTDTDLKLKEASWIADTGRFANAMKSTDNLSEVEPVPDPGEVVVPRGAITACVRPAWEKLPRDQI